MAFTPDQNKVILALIHKDKEEKRQHPVTSLKQRPFSDIDLQLIKHSAYFSLHLPCNKLIYENVGYPHLSSHPDMNYSPQHGYSIMYSACHLG